MPTSRGLRPPATRPLVRWGSPQFGLGGLQPSEKAETPKGMEHVHVNQVQAHPRERFPEEGDVEARAVERDEHLGLSERTGKVLEVVALDEGAFPPSVVDADHGDGVPADRESCRLDVEVHDVTAKR